MFITRECKHSKRVTLFYLLAYFCLQAHHKVQKKHIIFVGKILLKITEEVQVQIQIKNFDLKATRIYERVKKVQIINILNILLLSIFRELSMFHLK